MKKHIWVCLAFFLAIGLTAEAQKNLVSNGSFEDDLYEWNGADKAKITPWDHKDGKNSCAIIVTNTANWIGLDQQIRIPKNAQGLEFSAWLKTVNVVKGDNEWMGAIYSIEFLDKAGKKLGEGVNISRLTGDTEWEQYKKGIKIPLSAISFKILLAMGYASGTMLIDDVTARVMSADEVAKL